MIIRKLVKIVATRYHILKPKCTKFDFGWRSAPGPAGGAYSTPKTLAAFKGPISKGRGGEEKGREERKMEGGTRERTASVFPQMGHCWR